MDRSISNQPPFSVTVPASQSQRYTQLNTLEMKEEHRGILRSVRPPGYHPVGGGAGLGPSNSTRTVRSRGPGGLGEPRSARGPSGGGRAPYPHYQVDDVPVTALLEVSLD